MDLKLSIKRLTSDLLQAILESTCKQVLNNNDAEKLTEKKCQSQAIWQLHVFSKLRYIHCG